MLDQASVSVIYTPLDWYWLASDGRLYASARGSVVGDDDVDYATWSKERSHGATVWPADDSGAQTNEALFAVVSPLGLSISGYTGPAARASTAKSK